MKDSLGYIAGAFGAVRKLCSARERRNIENFEEKWLAERELWTEKWMQCVEMTDADATPSLAFTTDDVESGYWNENKARRGLLSECMQEIRKAEKVPYLMYWQQAPVTPANV